MNKKPFISEEVVTVLTVATKQHPQSAIVYSRWGDYYLKMKDKEKAILSFKKAIELDPNDQQSKDVLVQLIKI